jgi:hypothetical protein
MLRLERNQDRVLVREVLVKRSDGNTGPLRDVVGRGPGVSALGENVSSRLEDLLHGEPGSLLNRPFPGL